MLRENERLDDLEYNGLRVIQSADGYCFTSDSVFLANLSGVKRGDRVVEIGCGCGVVSLLIAAKFSPEKVFGVEIQHRLAEMAKRSVELNGLTDKIEIVCAPAQGVHKEIGHTFDVVVANPPYEEAEKKAEYTEKEICKTEAKLTAVEAVECGKKLLRYGGKFIMINRVRRLIDVLTAMREKGIEPKKLYLIQPKASLPIDTFIVEGKKGAKPSLLVPKPLVIYEENGEMTDFTKKIYHKNQPGDTTV